jgi:uncharacterized protein
VTTRDMTSLDYPELAAVVASQPYPLAFVTVSGAHLYGFPSRDSDVDLRGAHQLPLDELVGLRNGPRTLDRSWSRDGMEVDLVTHDLEKFFRLMLRRNGYVLEQVLSPLVVASGDLHGELVALAPRLVTRHHVHHYRGFSATQRRLFTGSGELKPLLYTFRTLLTGIHLMLTGIHLMLTGEIVANLPALLDEHGGPPYLPDLIAAKTLGEHNIVETTPGIPGVATIMADLDALLLRLDDAERASRLPENADAEESLHQLLVLARLAGR